MKCYYCGKSAEQEIAEIWVCDDEECVADAEAVLRCRQEGPQQKEEREPMPWWNDEIGELVYG